MDNFKQVGEPTNRQLGSLLRMVVIQTPLMLSSYGYMLLGQESARTHRLQLEFQGSEQRQNCNQFRATSTLLLGLFLILGPGAQLGRLLGLAWIRCLPRCPPQRLPLAPAQKIARRSEREVLYIQRHAKRNLISCTQTAPHPTTLT